jgi:catechol 2,3-dioxygenase-like lactoylglutathione lyase family enzyme
MKARTAFTRAWLAALLALALTLSVSAQAPPPIQPRFIARGAFVALVVTDLDASVRWYQTNLGLHPIKRGKSPRVAAETAVLGSHNILVELIHYTDRSLPKREINDSTPVAGPIKAGAIVDPAGFDEIAKHLQSRGIEPRSFNDKEMGYRSFIVRDNDGNLIQFFAAIGR